VHKNSLRIGFLASAVLLSAPALAQADTGIEIVGLSVTESTLDEQAVTEILGGDLSSHAEGLAALDAQSIAIDRIAFVSPDDEAVRITLSGIVLANVVDGVAASIGIDSTEIVDDNGARGNYGLLTAADLDIQAWLSMENALSAPRIWGSSKSGPAIGRMSRRWPSRQISTMPISTNARSPRSCPAFRSAGSIWTNGNAGSSIRTAAPCGSGWAAFPPAASRPAIGPKSRCPTSSWPSKITPRPAK
jgi:hypothetical protein